jgi:hypothetical protein
LDKLFAEIHLVFDFDVLDVDDDDVQDRRKVLEEVVAVTAWSCRDGLERCGRLRNVLLKGGNAFFFVVIEDLEVGALEAVDWIAVAVGYGDVGEDEPRIGLDGVAGILGCLGRKAGREYEQQASEICQGCGFWRLHACTLGTEMRSSLSTLYTRLDLGKVAAASVWALLALGCCSWRRLWGQR